MAELSGCANADGAAPQLPPSRFQPASLGLRADFRLTDFSKLKG